MMVRNKRQKINRKKVWLHPDGIARDYQKALLSVVKRFNQEISASFIRQDDEDSDDDSLFSEASLSATMVYLQRRGDEFFSFVIERLPSYFALVSSFNDKQWRLIVKGGTGVELPTSQAVIAGMTHVPVSSGVLGVDAYRAEPWLAEMQRLWVSQNVDLINSIPADELDDMKAIIERGIMNGSSVDTIKQEIKARFEVTENRAKLIAVDQVQKANAALAAQRMKDVGVESYIWRGVLDIRERPWHVSREGKQYRFDSPPQDGNPGQPVRCRCYGYPVWDGSVFDVS